MVEKISLKQIIQAYRTAYPESRTLTDEEILSVLNNSLNDIELREEEKISMFGLDELGYSGLNIEKQSPSLTMPESSILEAALRTRINKVTEDTNKVEDKNGFIGKAWSWAKNTLGFGDSSNKVRDKQKAELAALNSGDIKTAFKSITGLDYTVENVNKFLNNEVKTISEQTLDGYKEGQNMVADITGDIVSGIASVGIFTISVAAAPFTGGASIAVGLAAATAAGGLIKSGVKALDSVVGGRNYDSFGHDLITGGFSGILAPITGGVGGAAGNAVAKTLGIQAVKHVGKGAAQSGIKAILMNPMGYEYIGGSIIKRALSFGTELAVDGALGGAIDGGFRNGVEQYEKTGEINFDKVLDATVEGGIGGALFSPVIGGGMKIVGKGGNKLGRKIHQRRVELQAFRENAEQQLLDRITKKSSLEEVELVNIIKNRITNKNKNLVALMLEDKSITNEQILNILDSLTKTSSLHPTSQIFTLGLISNIHFKNDSLRIKYAKQLLMNRDIPRDQISTILENLYDKNSKLLNAMLQKENFDKQNISNILRNTYYLDSDGIRKFPNNRQILVGELMDNPNIPNNYIADIIDNTYHTNIQLCKQLCNQKDFPPDHISALLNNVLFHRNGQADFFTSNTEFKIKLAGQLLNDTNCPKEFITDIISSIDSKQSKLFKQLYSDNNIPKSELASILHIEYGLRKGKKLSFQEKVAILTNSTSIDEATIKYLKKYGIDAKDVDNLINNISLEMGLKKYKIEISDENAKGLFKNFIANNGNIEQIIKSLPIDNYSKGIPLKYSRKQFITDIETLIKDLNIADQDEILQYFGISLSKENFEGFPILPNNSSKKFREDLEPIVEKIKNKIEDFTYKNETTIDNSEIKSLYDSLIKGCPEFTSIIGKVQHGTHKYTVDTHTLKVLQNAMNDPIYNTLSDESKMALKFAILLHDIGKKGGVKDPGHYETSAKYAISILDKYNLTPRVKSKIIDIIYNHHWFEQFNKNRMDAKEVNARFRSPNDLKIAMLMAKSDLMGINNDFHFKVTGTKNLEDFNNLFNHKMQEIFRQQRVRYTKMNMVMDTKFHQTATRHFPVETVLIDGKNRQIQVLNLVDDSVSDDLFQYGFAPGTTKNSARFLVHMNDKIKGLNVFYALSSSPVTESIQSLSLISRLNNRTYKNRIYGVVCDTDMKNVAQASYANMASGYKKSLKTFTRDLYNPLHTVTYVRDEMLDFLSNKGIQLSKEEYAELSSKLIDIQYSTQITQDIQIGSKTIKASLMQEALEYARESLFKGDLHSEIVVINPRVKALIARVSSLAECKPEFLKFAADNNLPIILIGFKNPN